MPDINTGKAKGKLKQLLSLRQQRLITDTARIPSAVLLPLFISKGRFHILFIKRTETVKVHKGQISFPGGTCEKGETRLATALRECAEEVGLRARDVEILGELDDELTVSSNYVVSTFVGMMPWPYRFKLNKEEVAETIELPIAELLARECRQPYYIEPQNKAADSYAYYCQDRVIWGATARILDQFLEVFTRAARD
jgi:8-oxo-dGTP pyrophosphatase MutT (NUDIX family)